ncbi:MAG: hypothetical protein P8M80_18730 [Pirellulaceae bacterium]|nr:hypothetical protein [Pirellulaceae bacterium]
MNETLKLLVKKHGFRVGSAIFRSMESDNITLLDLYVEKNGSLPGEVRPSKAEVGPPKFARLGQRRRSLSDLYR